MASILTKLWAEAAHTGDILDTEFTQAINLLLEIFRAEPLRTVFQHLPSAALEGALTATIFCPVSKLLQLRL